MSGIDERSGVAGGGDPDGSAGGAGVLPRGIDEPPPFWRRWSRLYLLVAGLLAFDVLAFWLLTRWAS
jgi:hypothetical protein